MAINGGEYCSRPTDMDLRSVPDNSNLILTHKVESPDWEWCSLLKPSSSDSQPEGLQILWEPDDPFIELDKTTRKHRC